MLKRTVTIFFMGLLWAQSLWAYTYNKTTVGPLSVDIAKPGVMQKLDEPLEMTTTLKNALETPLAVTLTFTTIETVVFAETGGKTLTKSVEVPAKGQLDVKTSVVGKPGTLSVHYPVYLKAEWTPPHLTGTPRPEMQTAAVVQPFESTITPNPNWPTTNPLLGKRIENPAELPLNTIPDGAGLSLADISTYRGFWTLDQEKNAQLHFEPVGWQGASKDSAANASRQSMVRGGVSRQSLNMHPPYRKGPGNVGLDYRIKLPNTTPISFSCYAAMRDVDTKVDNPTDGVTFRIVAVDGKDEKIVAEKHVAGTNWEPIDADLTPFAGKDILLRLISDPGPKRDTTCDSSYWGDPTILAGKKPVFADPVALRKQQDELHVECVAAMKSGATNSKRTQVFELDGGQRAVLTCGDYGIVDGKIALGTPEKFVVYDGIEITVKDQPIAKWPTTLAAYCVGEHMPPALDVAVDNQKATLNVTVRKNGPGLQVGIDCTEKTWITSLRLGPASDVVDKVYYGHGYCVVKPKAFTVGADGHRLSTSHVGFEYPNGISVLLASTMPPRELVVDPERKIATTVIHPATTLTLLPGDKGMFDCAIRYRAINPKKAAPGVKTKAGRFCFDLWGGKYKRHDEIVDNAIRYGLTDSLVIIHGWQRYGYDNRLPDIWPPHTGPGTLAEMQKTLEKCDASGILYGLHDNYIDFYPDAEGYSMDVLSFERNGQPRKAWFNRGIQARSYQFRPDKFIPFLERNFDMMLPELRQSCYFVDVFSSIAPPDFYDREGNLHTRAETLAYWGKGFDIMRERLTKFSRYPASSKSKQLFHAPTISESGDDFLIGHLDGADCQFGRIDNKPNDFVSVVPCEDWERIPWFDAVNHTTFSLHGVGYSNRYEGGTGRTLHGIESDDYICSEILTGHPAMVDLGCATRGAVRKYWLLHDTMRELADCEIDSVEFVGDDVHRQKIVWKSPDGLRKTTIHINRGETDWTCGPLVLPPYGFTVAGPNGRNAAIYRTKTGEVVEYAGDPLGGVSGRIFVNGRQKQATDVLPITPGVKPNSFQYSGGNGFKAEILWRADAAPKTDYSVFVHLVPEAWKPKSGDNEGIVTTFGVNNTKPVTEWSGEIVTPFTHTAFPDNAPAGKYRILVGFYDAKGDGHRPRLLAKDNDNCRYEIGLLTVVRNAEGIVTDMKIDTEPQMENVSEFQRQLHARLLPPKGPIDFGIIRTKGAFLCDFTNDWIVLTPLPDEPATEVGLNLGTAVNYRVTAQDADGKTIREVPIERQENRTTFMTEKGEFRYVIQQVK